VFPSESESMSIDEEIQYSELDDSSDEEIIPEEEASIKSSSDNTEMQVDEKESNLTSYESKYDEESDDNYGQSDDLSDLDKSKEKVQQNKEDLHDKLDTD
jgi:hypothetical protein